MPRYRNENGVDIQLTAAEETQRDVEEATHAADIIDPVRLMAVLRVERNALLAASDNRFLSDAPVERGSQAWITYRQELRDLPANTADPITPTWPIEPGV